MFKKVALTLAAVGAFMVGGALHTAPANAAGDLLIKVHGKGHHWHHHGKRGKHWKHHKRHWKHRHNHGWRYRSAYPYGCRWVMRPHRVRVHDRYYGWHVKTIWRPVHICR